MRKSLHSDVDELFSCVGYPPLGGVKAAQDAFYAAWPRQVKSPQNRVKLLGPRGRLAIIVIIKRFIGVKFSERLGGIFRSQSGNGIGGVLLRQSASRNLRRFRSACLPLRRAARGPISAKFWRGQSGHGALLSAGNLQASLFFKRLDSMQPWTFPWSFFCKLFLICRPTFIPDMKF